MISTAEETATSPAPAAEAQPKASKKARGAQKRGDVAKKKAKSAKKASPDWLTAETSRPTSNNPMVWAKFRRHCRSSYHR